ncbi:MAG: PAS domain-containing sensor histidine kinase [Magnetospirillum sp.]|nr:PAS domain-containing sensor histidine kinase [Magnetospirillum sp.]
MSLTTRIVTVGLVVAGLLWLGLDFLQTRQIEDVAARQLLGRLEEKARRDRLRLDNALRGHHTFVRLLTQMQGVRRHVDAVVSGQGTASRAEGDPDWLPSRHEQRAFTRIEWVVVLDEVAKLREIVALGGEDPLAALNDLPARVFARAAEGSMLVRLDGALVLVSAAPVEGRGWLVAVSRLDSRFLASALGRFLDPSFIAALIDSDSGLTVATTDAAEVPPGSALASLSERYLVTGKAHFDYDIAERKLSFASLVPRAHLTEMSAPLLTVERTQRTVLAAAMSGLFLVVLAYLSWRLRRLTERVSDMSRRVFGVDDVRAGGDELVGLEAAVGRLVAEVETSREALKREAQDRLNVMAERMMARAEAKRLALLQGVTEMLGVGIIRIGSVGASAENAVMDRFAGECGGLQAFLAADDAGVSELCLGEGTTGRIFEVTSAHEFDLGLLLVRDVTERRRAEAAVASFALFPAQNPHPVLRVGADGVVQHANDACDQLLASWGSGIGCAAPGNWRVVFDEALRSGQQREVEAIVGDRVLSLNVVPLPSAGYVNIYGADVTARVSAERLLYAANETLELRVAERTEALQAEVAGHIRAEEKALAAKEQAELANRTKTEFLANMSHELRTPLNAIIGFSEVIETEVFGPVGTPRYHEYAGDILASGRHLLALINDILDVAKIEAGEMMLELEPVAVAEIVRSALRLVEVRAALGRVDLSARFGDDLPLIEADRRRLLQILVNLLANAVKFTPEGGKVRVFTHRDGNHMVFAVGDTGIGMSPEEIQQALKTFRQVDGSLARRYEGVGLGLPLARSLVELHQGRMVISSAKAVPLRGERGRPARATLH